MLIPTTVLIPIVGATVGSVLTALIGAFYRRARPVVIVDEITLSASPAPRSTVAVPDLGLAALCADSEFVSVELGPREPLEESEYVKRLRKALDEVRTASADLPTLHEVAKDLDACLQRGDYEEYASVFSRESPRIWPSLISARGRGGFDYRGEGPPPVDWNRTSAQAGNDSGANGALHDLTEDARVLVKQTPRHDQVLRSKDWKSDIVIDADGEFVMPINGPRDLGFPWTEVNSGQRANAYVFAMRTAVAVAAQHRSDLQQVTSFLLKIQKVHSAKLEETQAKLEAELKRYDRLLVKGIIANRGGGSPVSATNIATLFVRLTGQSYIERISASETKSHEYPEDVAVKMRLGSEEFGKAYDFDSSLTVEAGSVVRFIASSSEPISRLTCEPALLAAMTGGDRECYLGVMVVAPRRWWTKLRRKATNFSPRYTDSLDFRDSEAKLRIPYRDERRWWSRGRSLRRRPHDAPARLA